MLLRDWFTMFPWQLVVPQLTWATRKSPGFTKRMKSADSRLSSVYERVGFDALRHAVGYLAGGAAGHQGDVAMDLLDEGGDIGVVDEDHPALGAGDVAGEERVVHMGQEVHDGVADTDQVKGRGGHKRGAEKADWR